ncbi:unnamed protein product [Rhodiola kirilowii]
MKREYTDPQKEPNSAASPAAAIFPNISHERHPHHFIPPYSSPLHFHQQPFQFQIAASRDGDDESCSGAATPNPTHSQPDPVNNNNDGASIEVQRRPRGRPPGSKNRLKQPVVITCEPDPIMTPSILEIPNGVDVVYALQNYSSRRNTSLSILSASGSVANVTIRQQSPNSSSAVTFQGRFDILSLTATFIAPSSHAYIPAGALNVAISLSVPQGQIIGGIVAGPLIASGTVFIIAAAFSNPSFLRLPVEDEAGRSNNATSSGGNEGQSPSAAASGDNDNNNNYNSCSLATDVIWAPTTRQPY